VNGVLTQVHCKFQFVIAREKKQSMKKSQSASHHQVADHLEPSCPPNPTHVLGGFVLEAIVVTEKRARTRTHSGSRSD
jgi:hypothetical protein